MSRREIGYYVYTRSKTRGREKGLGLDLVEFWQTERCGLIHVGSLVSQQEGVTEEYIDDKCCGCDNHEWMPLEL